jgi:hypothetical protein
MYEQYKPRHPLAWGIIAGAALFSAVAIGAIQGWLPIGNSRAAQACAECAVIESVKAIETPAMPPVDEAASEPAVAGEASVTSEQVAALVYSYETTVRFEDGTTSVFSYAAEPTWKSGDKVRVVDGAILAQG